MCAPHLRFRAGVGVCGREDGKKGWEGGQKGWEDGKKGWEGQSYFSVERFVIKAWGSMSRFNFEVSRVQTSGSNVPGTRPHEG